MREIVQEWVERGDSDLEAAKILAHQKGLENQTGFHCQQAIEKWLKAYLLKQGEELRKIHDLTALVINCEKYDSGFQELEPLVEGITDFAVELAQLQHSCHQGPCKFLFIQKYFAPSCFTTIFHMD